MEYLHTPAAATREHLHDGDRALRASFLRFLSGNVI